MIFQCYNPLLVWCLRKPARLGKIHLFGQQLLFVHQLLSGFRKHYVDETISGEHDGNQDVNVHSCLQWTSNNDLGKDVTSGCRNKIPLKFENCAIYKKVNSKLVNSKSKKAYLAGTENQRRKQ